MLQQHVQNERVAAANSWIIPVWEVYVKTVEMYENADTRQPGAEVAAVCVQYESRYDYDGLHATSTLIVTSLMSWRRLLDAVTTCSFWAEITSYNRCLAEIASDIVAFLLGGAMQHPRHSIR